MSRAFIIEGEDMFHCERKNKDCKHANLRGGCDLDCCKDDDVKLEDKQLGDVSGGNTMYTNMVGESKRIGAGIGGGNDGAKKGTFNWDLTGKIVRP